MYGFKMNDPDMDIRRLSKKLFPYLWVHYGVITAVPPAGPMSPAQVMDIADKMAEAVIVFSYSLRPVLRYYLDKHSRSMEGSKISFWTHLSFLCLRIRLRRDHPFDYFLNATAVVAECAVTCAASGLDEVHAWATTFFCAFFENELIGQFYSAGGWAGLMNYVQDGDLKRVFDRLPPREGSVVLVEVASEPLSAARRERLTAARGLRGDEIERFEPAKILVAKIFRWDFAEKFPMSPPAPGCFRRTQNIRRKTRSKSESMDIRLHYVDIEPSAASSAPNLRYIDRAKPSTRFPNTRRSISIDIKSESADIRTCNTSTLDTLPRVKEETSPDKSKFNLTQQRNPDSLLVNEPACSPMASFNSMKTQSRIAPNSLFPILMDENESSAQNLQEEGNNEVGPDCRQRFSLPTSNRRTLIDAMHEKNPSVFQHIFKDDYTLRKSKKNKDQLWDKDLTVDQNKNYSSQKKTLSLEDSCATSEPETVRKNSKASVCSHWRTLYNKLSLKTDKNTNALNYKNFWTDDSMKPESTDFMDSEKVRKNSKDNQSSSWRTSFESISSLATDESTTTDVDNSDNIWTNDSMKNESIDSIETENVRKNSMDDQSSCWKTSCESISSLATDESTTTDVDNSNNIWTDDFMMTESIDCIEPEKVGKNSKDNKSSCSTSKKTVNFVNPKNLWTTDFTKNETEDMSEFLAQLLLIKDSEDHYSEQDKSPNKDKTSECKHGQMDMKLPDMDNALFPRSYCSLEGKESESLLINSSSRTCNQSKGYKMSQTILASSATGTLNDTTAPISPISQHSSFKSFYHLVKEGRKVSVTSPPSTDKSDSDDETERVIIQPHTQTVQYERRLSGSLAKRTENKVRSDRQCENPGRKNVAFNLNFNPTGKKEDTKKVSNIMRALKSSGAPNPYVFKI